MGCVASILTVLFVANAFAYKSIYSGNLRATSSEKTKTAAAGIKLAPAG